MHGKWEFIKVNGTQKSDIAQDECFTDSAQKSNLSPTVLEMSHSNKGEIIIYINGKLAFSFIDHSDLTGDGVGVFVYSAYEASVIVSFDDFAIYPQ